MSCEEVSAACCAHESPFRDILTTKESDKLLRHTWYSKDKGPSTDIQTDLLSSIANHIYRRTRSEYHIRVLEQVIIKLGLSCINLKPVQSNENTVYRIRDSNIDLTQNQLKDYNIVLVEKDETGILLTILDEIPK